LPSLSYSFGALVALEPIVRQRLASYMDEFYETIGDSQAVERKIRNRCIEKTGTG